MIVTPGKVTVSKDGVKVEGFFFRDIVTADGLINEGAHEAMSWAIERLKEHIGHKRRREGER